MSPVRSDHKSICLFWNMSDTNRSADEQTCHPVVWVGVITLEQKRPLAIANIREILMNQIVNTRRSHG